MIGPLEQHVITHGQGMAQSSPDVFYRLCQLARCLDGVAREERMLVDEARGSTDVG